MRPHLDILLAAEGNPSEQAAITSRRTFSVDFGHRGVFATFGRFDLYLCGEPDAAWSFLREPGGFDAQGWRLHLIVSRVPE